MSNRYYKPMPEGIELKKSAIEGYGIFTKHDLPLDEIIGISHLEIEQFDQWQRSPIGGYLNHSGTPNCELISKPKGDITMWLLKTKTAIKAGDELTIKYRTYNPEE